MSDDRYRARGVGEPDRTILDHLIEHGPSSRDELADAIGLDAPVGLNHCIGRLRRSDLIAPHENGSGRQWEATPSALPEDDKERALSERQSRLAGERAIRSRADDPPEGDSLVVTTSDSPDKETRRRALRDESWGENGRTPELHPRDDTAERRARYRAQEVMGWLDRLVAAQEDDDVEEIVRLLNFTDAVRSCQNELLMELREFREDGHA